MENCEKAMGENKSRVKHWEKELKKLRRAEEQDCDYDDDEDEEDADDISQVDEHDKEQKNDRATDASMTEGQEEDGDVEMETTDNEQPKSKPKAKVRIEKKKMTMLPIYNEQALEQYDKEEVKNDIDTLEDERKTMAKNANMAAIAEYKKKEEDYLAR